MTTPNGTDIPWSAIGLSTLGAVLAFLGAWFVFLRDAAAKKKLVLAEDHQKLLERVAELEKSLALVAQSVVPISTAFQAILIKQLTHQGTPEMDALMVKIGPPYQLNHDEERRLVVLLNERAQLEGTMLTESERHAASMLPWLIMRVKTESEMNVPALTAAAIATGANPVAEKKAEEKSGAS